MRGVNGRMILTKERHNWSKRYKNLTKAVEIPATETCMQEPYLTIKLKCLSNRNRHGPSISSLCRINSYKYNNSSSHNLLSTSAYKSRSHSKPFRIQRHHRFLSDSSNRSHSKATLISSNKISKFHNHSVSVKCNTCSLNLSPSLDTRHLLTRGIHITSRVSNHLRGLVFLVTACLLTLLSQSEANLLHQWRRKRHMHIQLRWPISGMNGRHMQRIISGKQKWMLSDLLS